MSDLKFEGNLDDVTEHQLKYVRSVLQKRGYITGKVLVEAVGKAGDNYSASVKRVVVEKDGVKFKMIAKFAPTADVQRIVSNTVAMFQNEHIVYTRVLPKYTEMLKEVDAPEDEKLRYATCYGTFMEAPNEVILLEDLQQSDFVMLDRFKSLTNDAVRLILKNFAILHSASFALKQQEPETFEEYKSSLVNIWLELQENEEKKKFMMKFEEDILKILDSEKYKKLVRGSISQLGNYFMKNAGIDSKSRYTVIQQGDPWTNNIMFRLQGDKPVECCMIDYQVTKIGTPVGDLHYMIFNCTDYEARSKYYNEWIDYYHSELDKSLSNFGLKASYIYPRDQLDTEMRRYAKLSYCTAMFLSSMLIRESSDAAKMQDAMISDGFSESVIDEAQVSALDAESILRFKNRIEGIIDSFHDLGYFTQSL